MLTPHSAAIMATVALPFINFSAIQPMVSRTKRISPSMVVMNGVGSLDSHDLGIGSFEQLVRWPCPRCRVAVLSQLAPEDIQVEHSLQLTLNHHNRAGVLDYLLKHFIGTFNPVNDQAAPRAFQ